MQKFKRKFIEFCKEYKWAIASGLMMATSYIPFPPWAVLFCWLPLWSHICNRNLSLKSIFWQSWVSQFIFSIIGFYWIYIVSYEYGHMPLFLAILVLILFACTVHIYFPLAFTLAKWLQQKFNLQITLLPYLMAILLVLFEYYFPQLFPWNYGYPLMWAHLPVAQTADIWGMMGLSFFVLLCNAIICSGFTKSRKQLLINLVIAVLLFGMLNLLGVYQKKKWQHFDQELKVLLVQANIGNLEKYIAERGAGFQDYIANRYFDLTKEAVRKYPDSELIIWPESAFPDYLNFSQSTNPTSKKFFEFQKEIKKSILTGAYSSLPNSNENSGRQFKDFNAAFVFDGNGKQLGEPYHKVHLLMYGEYTPLAEYFPWLTKISPAGEGFFRGEGPQVQPFKDYTLGIQICYDSLYPEFSESLARQGARIIVNLTNDSWFGDSWQHQQHMQMTLARALETRRPLIRNTNTGISTAILADGTEFEKSPSSTSWFQQFKISFQKNPPLTIFTQYGSWLPLFFLLCLILLVMRGRTK